MNFKQFFSRRSMLQLIFVLVVFALLIPLAIWDSDTQVKVNFNTTGVNITSDQYTMTIKYEEIASAELTDLADPGEKVTDGYDNDIIRTGIWENDIWGEYYINADLDATNCIVVHLEDGRIFVFNCKNNDKTADLYETLQTYLPDRE